MQCFINSTGAFLPGAAVSNHEMERFLGSLEGESEVKDKILKMNGIAARHYAQDEWQQATHDVYELGAEAAVRCLQNASNGDEHFDPASISYLAAGTTYSPLAAPGYASLLHNRLAQRNCLNHPVEIGSHSGICSSAANALVSGIRAVAGGFHKSALCVAGEHASEILKSSVIRPIDDRSEHENIRNSRWFMSVFLRFMLSDGGGAFLLQNQANPNGASFQVNWTHSASFANETPLCMKLENRSELLSQDISVLSKYLLNCGSNFLRDALDKQHDTLDSHSIILPHISSFFFRRKMEKVIANHCADPNNPVPYWSNLATVGNTGSASMFIMLDEYLRTHKLKQDEKLLLFVPESGQFNFVLISLTAVLP
jgi:3-oxoacyl-[acyl-carrier-protein] synthase-3